MTKYLIILSLLLSNNEIFGQLSSNNVNLIVNAIGKIENSVKYPYGIKSIPLKGDTFEQKKAYARRICTQTIINNYKRWQNSNKSLSYLEFLQRRYCPIGASDDTKNLNSNWLRNLRKELDGKVNIQ